MAKISVVVVDDDKSLRNALVSGIREDKDQGWRLAGTASASLVRLTRVIDSFRNENILRTKARRPLSNAMLFYEE